MKRVLALILLIILGGMLLQIDHGREYGGSYDHYVQNWEETNIPNLVTAVLVDWRAYDTLGEATILFTSALGFYLILGGDDDKNVKGG